MSARSSLAAHVPVPSTQPKWVFITRYIAKFAQCSRNGGSYDPRGSSMPIKRRYRVTANESVIPATKSVA